MITFDILEDIIAKKKGDVLVDEDAEKEFSPYMTQRWLSMYSSEFATIVNSTTNTFWRIFTTKQEWYKYFLMVIPKRVNKRIPYIKKAEKSKTKGIEPEYIQFLAEHLELSQAEIKQYIETAGLQNKDLKKLIGE